MNKTRVFVYGTLMSGLPNHRLLVDQKFIKEDYLAGFDMYSMGGFPGIVKNDCGYTSLIKGEVWEVDDKALSQLDMLEGFRGLSYAYNFYDRVKVHTEGERDALVYVQATKPNNDLIEGGDWKEFIMECKPCVTS